MHYKSFPYLEQCAISNIIFILDEIMLECVLYFLNQSDKVVDIALRMGIAFCHIAVIPPCNALLNIVFVKYFCMSWIVINHCQSNELKQLSQLYQQTAYLILTFIMSLLITVFVIVFDAILLPQHFLFCES